MPATYQPLPPEISSAQHKAVRLGFGILCQVLHRLAATRGGPIPVTTETTSPPLPASIVDGLRAYLVEHIEPLAAEHELILELEAMPALREGDGPSMATLRVQLRPRFQAFDMRHLV